MSQYHPPATAPHDRRIDVRILGEDLWVRVRWNEAERWFDVDGEGSWIEANEIDAWREAVPWPSIGIGTRKP